MNAAASSVGPGEFACIVGAPRCGTTMLASFLQDHPDVCFSNVKEPHFFSRRELDDLTTPELRRRITDEYLARYFPDRTGALMLAEGSVSYLYAPERMAAILRCWPNARFIIALRDPLEMLPSLHQRLLYTGDETVTDFAEAWALMPERAQGRRIPRTCVDGRLLQYAEAGRLGTHVAAFFEAVGRERCFVVLLEDLASSPAAVYADLLEFLRLRASPRLDFIPRRASRGYRLGWLQRLLKRPPVATRAVLAGEPYRRRVKRLGPRRQDPALVRGVLAGRKLLLRWNRAPAPPVQLPPALRMEICKRLAGEVAQLSALLGRDLAHWLDGAPAAAAAIHEGRASPASVEALTASGSRRT